MIRLVFLIAFWLAIQPLEATDAKRQIIFLDGTWSVQRSGADVPADAPQGMAVDGHPNTSWVSAPGDQAWIEVDLGKEQSIGMVRTGWPANYAKHIPSTLNHAKDYIIEISDDEANWRTVATVTDADGYHPNNKFAPVMGRYVRVTATKAANSSSGIGMTELEVYPPSGTP